MGEWLSKSNVVIFGLFVVVCLLVAERPQLNARRCPTDVQEGKSGSVLVDVDTMREKRDEQNKEEITKKEEYKKEEYKQGVSDRQSEHVQNFLKNAAALPSNVVPTEPFVDDTSNARPVLSQVDDRLFVGSQWAAIALSEGINVGSLNITGILNVAFDLDVDFVDEAHFVGAAQKSNRRHKLQLAKVGLVDGSGNHIGTLAAAVLALRQLLDFKEALLEKDANIFPNQIHRVLVHCQMGRSRSILVVSLYLYYSKKFSSFQSALDHVKLARHVRVKNFPRSDLRSLAESLISKHPDLFETF